MSGDAEDLQGTDELRELRRALGAVREDLHRRFGLGPGVPPESDRANEPAAAATQAPTSVPAASGFDPIALFEELRRRLGAFGGGERRAEVDDFGLEPSYLARARPLLDFLYDRWWRVEVSGAENLPPDGRVLLVANRSGVLPYDGLMTAHAVERSHPERRRPRFLVADWLVTLPFSQPLLARVGGVRACPENAGRLLRSGEWVVAFPEGQKGALKPYRDRYRLQRFGRGGFVSLAIRERATVIPVAIVGAEEAHPILFKPGLPARLLGVPVPVTPTFPQLGPLGLIPLPARWRIRFGPPIALERDDPDAADDPLYLGRAREQIRGCIQSMLDAELGA